METRVAIYARFSCDKQRDASIEDQIDACTEYCAKHEGYRVVEAYCDYAMSGRSDDRPQFLRMVEDAQAHKFDIIVLWKLDRFARNMQDQYYYEHILSKAGVHIESVKEDIVGTGIEATSMKALTALFAQIRSQQSAEDCMRGMLGKARKCQYLGVWKFGYSHDGDIITLDERWAPVAYEAHMRYLHGDSMPGVLDWLISQGVRTSRGTEPGLHFLQQMLNSDWYAGVYTWGFERDRSGNKVLDEYGKPVPLVRVEGGVPAIVSMETKMLVRKRMGTKRICQGEVLYSLTGKLFCSECGKPLVGYSGTSRKGVLYRYYVCSGGRRTCFGTMPKGRLEEDVAHALRSMLNDDALCEYLAERHMQWQGKSTAGVAAVKAAEKELRDVKKRRSNMLKAVEDGLDYAAAKGQLDQLNRETNQAEKRVETAKAGMQSASKEDMMAFFKALANGFASDEQLIDAFVQKAYLYGETMAVAMNFKDADTSRYELEIALGLESKEPEAGASGSSGNRMVDRRGLEPRTLGLRVPCSTN